MNEKMLYLLQYLLGPPKKIVEGYQFVPTGDAYDFYLDDGLKSVPSVKTAIDLIRNTQAMCAKAGLRLHKFSSNKKEVIQAVAPEDRAKGLQELDLACDPLPLERTLVSCGVLSQTPSSSESLFKIVHLLGEGSCPPCVPYMTHLVLWHPSF